VIDRDLGLCQIKGPHCTTYATEVDHIVPRIEGGALFDPANLRAACRACNSRAGAQLGNSRAAARGARYRQSTAPYLSRF
jgi:5-methylcytosine-specific restriction endonuclease McrA